MLKKLRAKMADYQPLVIDTDLPEAAVLVPITDSVDPSIILTKRSARLSTHSGEVAFPGGKRDAEDQDLVATALRESFEEIALEPDDVDIVGQLGHVVSRFGLHVTPFVGIVRDDVQLLPNEAEIEAIFKVPLSYFLEQRPAQVHRYPFRDEVVAVPSYRFHGYTIWGLTAFMIKELYHDVFGMPLLLDDD